MPGWHVISYDCAKISHQNSTDPLDYPFEADSKSDIHCADNINEKKVFPRCLIYWNFVRRLFFSINDILWFISRSFLFLNLRYSLRIFNLVLSDYLSVSLSPNANIILSINLHKCNVNITLWLTVIFLNEFSANKNGYINVQCAAYLLWW